jgi:hypothetical protein
MGSYEKEQASEDEEAAPESRDSPPLERRRPERGRGRDRAPQQLRELLCRVLRLMRDDRRRRRLAIHRLLRSQLTRRWVRHEYSRVLHATWDRLLARGGLISVAIQPRTWPGRTKTP